MSIHSALLSQLGAPTELALTLDSFAIQSLEDGVLAFSVDSQLATALQALPIVAQARDDFEVVHSGWVLYKEQLYVGRLWLARASFLQSLKQRSVAQPNHAPVLYEGLDEAQSAVCNQALTQPFHFISGGPGSGKTHLAMALIRALIQDNPNVLIGFCAPTAKAVQRLQQDSVLSATRTVSVGTAHKLFHVSPHQAKWDARNTPFDVLIVDESSMLSIELAQHIMQCTPFAKHVVFLGDRYQLPSVEAGDTLEVILNHFPQHCSTLTKQYRFSSDSVPYQLAQACLGGQWAAFEQYAQIAKPQQALLIARWRTQVERWQGLRSTPYKILEDLHAFAVLNPLRRGLFGTDSYNLRLSAYFEYCGMRPVIGRANTGDFNNGQMGIALLQKNGQWQCFFHPDKPPVAWNAQQMDAAWMITVHQSQGSEYDTVWLWYEVDSETPSAEHFSMAHLYTAVTRSRAHIQCWCDSRALQNVFNNHESAV